MNILITGANGFVGSHLSTKLSNLTNVNLTLAARIELSTEFGTFYNVHQINSFTDWSKVLVGQTVVIHTAARTHVMKDKLNESLFEYQQVNVNGTLNLARQCINAGVRRFIYLSSIKVNGERTSSGKPFKPDDVPYPEDAYGISKYEAEQGLLELGSNSTMEVVIIRPPLVYGPKAKGNFATLIKVLKKKIPLPLGAVNNKRSLVSLDNLVDLIITCIDHSAAANQIFLAGDGDDISTTELLRGITKAMGKKSYLIPVPYSVLMLAASILGKKAVAQRLLCSLQVDISKARDLLGWKPPLTVDEGLRRCFENKN